MKTNYTVTHLESKHSQFETSIYFKVKVHLKYDPNYHLDNKNDIGYAHCCNPTTKPRVSGHKQYRSHCHNCYEHNRGAPQSSTTTMGSLGICHRMPFPIVVRKYPTQSNGAKGLISSSLMVGLVYIVALQIMKSNAIQFLHLKDCTIDVIYKNTYRKLWLNKIMVQFGG